MKAETRFLEELETLVERIVQESGDSRVFDARRRLREWMARPTAALGGKRPDELLRTEDGRLAVRELIERMQSGAYA